MGGSGEFGTAEIAAILAANSLRASSVLGISTTNAPGGTFSLTNNLTGAFGLTKAGNNTLVLAPTSGSNSFTGLITISSGTLSANTATINGGSITSGIVLGGGTLQAAAGGITTAKAVNLTAASTIDIATGNDSRLDGVVSGLALTKTGAGTLTLTATNTFIGLTVAQGTVSVPTVAANNANQPWGKENTNPALTLGSAGTKGTIEYTGATDSDATEIHLGSRRRRFPSRQFRNHLDA